MAKECAYEDTRTEDNEIDDECLVEDFHCNCSPLNAIIHEVREEEENLLFPASYQWSQLHIHVAKKLEATPHKNVASDLRMSLQHSFFLDFLSISFSSLCLYYAL